MCFDILNRLGVYHECVGQTDGQTDGQSSVSNSAVCQRALKISDRSPQLVCRTRLVTGSRLLSVQVTLTQACIRYSAFMRDQASIRGFMVYKELMCYSDHTTNFIPLPAPLAAKTSGARSNTCAVYAPIADFSGSSGNRNMKEDNRVI